MPPRVTPTTTKRRKTKNAAAAKKKGAVNGWGSSKLGGGQYQPQPQQTSSSPSSSSSSSTIGTKSTKKKKKSSGKSSKSQQTDVVKGVVSKSSLDAMVGLSKPATPSATTTPALSPAQSPSSTRRKKRTTETDRKRNAPGLIDEKDGSSPVAKRKKKKGVNKDKSTAETHFYTSEITHLMESVGRFDHIQYDANLLIEDIFRQYILNVAKESERIAMLRGHTEILVEDICFSVRSHPHLMKRIVTFFAYKQHGLTSKTSAITAEKVAVQMPQFEFMNTLMSDCPTLSLPVCFVSISLSLMYCSCLCLLVVYLFVRVFENVHETEAVVEAREESCLLERARQYSNRAVCVDISGTKTRVGYIQACPHVVWCCFLQIHTTANDQQLCHC
eukprot:m.125880 g.125880  ORF g.125880 m.125880 type:complete len:387 (+) comp12986_c0_seq2:39-1199(+)